MAFSSCSYVSYFSQILGLCEMVGSVLPQSSQIMPWTNQHCNSTNGSFLLCHMNDLA
jgi:hypothetical protein